MRTELSASPFIVYFYSGLAVAVGIAVAFVDPLFLVFSAIVIPQGLLGFFFWRVFIDDSGFSVSRRGQEQFFTFKQVRSVSVGMFGPPHLVLKLRADASIRRVRFFPEPSHGPFLFRCYRLKRQLEGILSAGHSPAQDTRAA